MMKRFDVGPLLVCEGDRLAGILTDRDITVRATAEGQDPFEGRVRDAMSTEVTYCFEDDDVATAARAMQEKQVRRLPVLDRGKRLVGIVSLGDLAVNAGDKEVCEETLQAVSEPTRAGTSPGHRALGVVYHLRTSPSATMCRRCGRASFRHRVCYSHRRPLQSACLRTGRVSRGARRVIDL